MSATTFLVEMHDSLRIPEAVKFAVVWFFVFCLLVATEVGGLYLLDALD
jgi:hypothetical protein